LENLSFVVDFTGLDKRNEFCGKDSFNVVVKPANESILRRNPDWRLLFGETIDAGETNDFPIAFDRERVNGGSIRPIVRLFAIDDVRFSAG